MAFRATLLALALAIVPAIAEAITIRDIIALSKAGLPDEILTAVIDADRTIFTLDAEQILELKRAGVSDAVQLKMVRSRREFEPTAPAAQTTEAHVPEEVAPQVVIIGGAKEDVAERPAYDERALRAFEGPYYFVPFPLWGTKPPHGHGHRVPSAPFINPEQRGFGRFMNDGWIGRR
jgi:hypothetical protein